MKKYLDTNKNIYCKPSEIHGVGIFAKEDLELNTTWWWSSPNNVLDITRNVYDRIRIASEHSETWSLFLVSVNTYSYYCPRKDALVYCLDNARYTNHSDSPNSIGALDDDLNHMSKLNCVVAKDTEITENYCSYGSCPWADECTHNLFNTRPFLTPEKDIEKGPMYITLTKDQMEVYNCSYLCTDIQKSLLTCVNQFGSFDNNIWKISIPYYKQIEGFWEEQSEQRISSEQIKDSCLTEQLALTQIQSKGKKEKFDQLLTSAKEKLNEELQEWLETLLEVQEEIVCSETNSDFLTKQLEKAKTKLQKELSSSELETICQSKVELVKLQLQIGETKGQELIIVPAK